MFSPRKILHPQENVTGTSMPTYLGGSKQIPSDAGTEQYQEQPKPPRSAFMCFADTKKKELMDAMGLKEANDEILKHVAAQWKSLSHQERAYWNEQERNDKLRFVREKAAYRGPWTIPKRRAKKHPLAPKRPMSAFLKYSQTRRSVVKRDNPDMSNTDVSRLLGEMWRNAHPKEKLPYIQQEEEERSAYKEDIKRWKDEQSRLDAASRTSHQNVQMMADYGHQDFEDRVAGSASTETAASVDDAESHEDELRVAQPSPMLYHARYVHYNYHHSHHPYEGHHPVGRSSSDILPARPQPPQNINDPDSEHYSNETRSKYFTEMKYYESIE